MQYYLLLILLIVIVYFYIFNRENFVIFDATTFKLQHDINILNKKLLMCNQPSINITKIPSYNKPGTPAPFNNDLKIAIDKYKNYDFDKCTWNNPAPTITASTTTASTSTI
jgi:hypothetical protein